MVLAANETDMWSAGHKLGIACTRGSNCSSCLQHFVHRSAQVVAFPTELMVQAPASRVLTMSLQINFVVR